MRRRLTSVACLALLMGCSDEPGDGGEDSGAVDGAAGRNVQLLLTTGYEACIIDGLGDVHCLQADNGELLNMGDGWLSGDHNFIAGSAGQTGLCLIDDPDGDGAGDLLCSRLNDARFQDTPDTYAGDFVQVGGTSDADVCGLDAAGAITCFESWGDNLDDQLDSPPVGPFDTVYAYGASSFSIVCGVDAMGGASCIGGGVAYERAIETCPLPASGVVDIATGVGVAVLLEDGSIVGWKHGFPTVKEDCFSEPPSNAYAVELVENALCTLQPGGSPSCRVIDSEGETGLVDDVPAGAFVDLSSYGSFGEFACVLAATDDISCWGPGWQGPATFNFGDLLE